MVGETLESLGLLEEPPINGFFVKEAVLPFKKFLGIDAQLGPEMRSTGEVMGLCDAILTPQLGALTFPVLARLAGPGLVVSDAEAMRAMALVFRHLKLVLEPGGAVALAAALFRADEIAGDAVIVVASGGNVDADRFAEAILA
jgi:threonine dehydratase